MQDSHCVLGRDKVPCFKVVLVKWIYINFYNNLPNHVLAHSCLLAAFFEASENFCTVIAAMGSKASNLPGGVRRIGELGI